MQAGTYFPKVRRMLLCFSPLILNTFGQLPRCFAGSLLLPFCLFLRPVLKFWSVGATLIEVHLGKSVRAKDFGLECMRDVQQLSRILHVGSVSVCLSSSVQIDKDFGGSISWNTQPKCRVFDELHTTGLTVLSYNSYFFNMATALLSSFFLDLLLGCSST